MSDDNVGKQCRRACAHAGDRLVIAPRRARRLAVRTVAAPAVPIRAVARCGVLARALDRPRRGSGAGGRCRPRGHVERRDVRRVPRVEGRYRSAPVLAASRIDTRVFRLRPPAPPSPWEAPVVGRVGAVYYIQRNVVGEPACRRTGVRTVRRQAGVCLGADCLVVLMHPGPAITALVLLACLATGATDGHGGTRIIYCADEHGSAQVNDLAQAQFPRFDSSPPDSSLSIRVHPSSETSEKSAERTPGPGTWLAGGQRTIAAGGRCATAAGGRRAAERCRSQPARGPARRRPPPLRRLSRDGPPRRLRRAGRAAGADRSANETVVPHVLAIVAGTTVDFPNNDVTYHNVFSLHSRAATFDLGRYAWGGPPPSVRTGGHRAGVLRLHST